jgi:hypothetical protein
VNGKEVKTKFRKARIQIDDTREKKLSREEYFARVGLACAIEDRNENQRMIVKAACCGKIHFVRHSEERSDEESLHLLGF